MKEMIKKYRGSLICSVLVMLIGVLVGFTSTQSMWANVFFVVTDCALVAIIFYDNRNRQQSRKIIGMTMWIIPIITLLYNGITRLVNMGADMENLFMAVIYYGTGLLFSGKLWVASGILCMLCGLFGESMAALVVYIISIMAAAIISILYSYLFYKKKLATGEGLKIQYNTKKSVIYLIIAISTIVFTIWTLFCGSIQVRCNDRDFNIEAKGWNDYTVEYSQIDSISYEENVLQNDNDYRTNGFGNLKYAMGNFKNDIFGDYIRYTHASCHSYVVMNIDGKILVVNGENDAETKEIYQRISEKVSKERK